MNPIPVYEDLSSFKLYMSDVGLLVMKAGVPQQTALSGEANLFMGSVAENYIAQALTSNGHPLYYWVSAHTAEVDFVIQKGTESRSKRA
jgi:predicted AAA+ superfamily ATPase